MEVPHPAPGPTNDANQPVGHPAGRGKPLGRRLFLTIAGAGALGVVFGNPVQSGLDALLSPIVNAGGGGLGALVPGAARFRFYTVTGSYPLVPANQYRLQVGGLVRRSRAWTLEELGRARRTEIVHTFQCVTGWRVPEVPWAGVRLGDLIDMAGPLPEAKAVEFTSYDGTYTESLTLEQAHRSDILVAYEMLGAPVTRQHGGPVRLYVAPMYGYKSIKWLKSISLVREAVPGFWEQQGYPVNAWYGSV
jgi:DMSO/TMAO reductase YedYZ molybdopterin-dependent catalytic subunit